MNAHLQKVSLTDVLQFFGKDFEPKLNTTIESVEVVAVDPSRDTVVYRITTKDI